MKTTFLGSFKQTRKVLAWCGDGSGEVVIEAAASELPKLAHLLASLGDPKILLKVTIEVQR